MNLYQLRYFSLLAKTGHFRKTAEQLCIAQPSLSHAISLLEQELGVTLFEKQGRHSVLTPEGKQFFSYIEKSLGILDEGIVNMHHIAMGEGLIELGLLRTLGSEFVPEVARKFLDDQKEAAVRFRFYTGNTTSLIEGLKDEKYDLVFCTRREQENSITFVPVARQDLVVIVPKDHPFSNRYTISLEELIPYPQICFSHSSGLRSVVDNLFEKIGQKPQIAYEIEEDIFIAGLVSKGFGVAVVPYMADLLRMDVKILQIAYPYWERKFYMATSKTHHLTPVVQKFYDFVMENYANAL